MAAIGAIAGILGSVVSAVGSLAAGAAQSRQLEAQAEANRYQAKIEDQKAMQERAVAQRKGFERQREGKLALSTLQARAAASGAGATDPTVVSLGSDIAGRSEYYRLTEMATGETAARYHEDQAALDRWSANEQSAQAGMAKTGAFFSAASSILGGASSAFGKFGGGTILPTANSLTPSASADPRLFPEDRFSAAYG